jgi:xylulokinase
LLNSPGNFTASKLRWVILNQPDLVKTAKAMLLPGDFIAYQLTGEPTTTIPGLSEGMLWDFNADAPATELLKLYSISPDLVPRRVPTFGEQGNVTAQAAQTLGIPKGIPVTYRAGDQPNNAFSLNVLDPGEVAATAGTSGVVYAVGGGLTTDPKSRVNAFAHVNHSSKAPRIGTLLCINGTGIANSWVRRLTGNGNMPYADLNTIAAQSAVGSQGVVVLPFGNGAERFFGDRLLSAQISGLDFTRQSSSDVLRSVQEGIAFSLATGLQLMPTLGITPKVIRAGLANMFLSPIFCETLAAVSGISIELYRTDGAEGAARGAAIGVGAYKDAKDAFRGFQSDRTINPPSSTSAYHEAMRRWTEALEALLAGANK